MSATYAQRRPLADAYDGPNAVSLAFDHAFAHVKSYAYGDPEPEPNPFCEFCEDARPDAPSDIDAGRPSDPA